LKLIRETEPEYRDNRRAADGTGEQRKRKHAARWNQEERDQKQKRRR